MEQGALSAPPVGIWQEIEIALTAETPWAAPYVQVEVTAIFENQTGLTVRRPAFWDGGRVWRVRFCAPTAGSWSWRSVSSVGDSGLARFGTVVVDERSAPLGHDFYDHGFWRMSAGGRSVVHADGTPAVLVGDTAWALPFRATVDQVERYAANRRAKGFNASLLMTVQPDMRAVGARDRTVDGGFDVGFEDLPTGHLNRINVDYYQYLDRLLEVLVRHQIVPVLQPLFHGFGWKGLEVAGPVVPPLEYARYCRYLVARYGARPAVYLVGADGRGDEPQIAAGGAEVHEWDAYAQPTGVHYRPHGRNRAHQDAEWLDFQWCQTGHEGEHVPERVADMWRSVPAKGVANAEPTYEETGSAGNGAGWWQGHEAWSNLCAGGTMGVVYGAASLWQWRLSATETGHLEYFLAPEAGWAEAMDFPGSTYVGLVSRILGGLPTADMEPDWCSAFGARGLSVPGRFNLVYKERGGDLRFPGPGTPLHYRVVDPRTAEVVKQGVRADDMEAIADAGGSPRLYILTPPVSGQAEPGGR